MTAAVRPYQDGDQAGLAALIDDSTPPLYATALVTETLRRDEPDGVALVAAVFAESPRRLADRGVPEVVLDGHLSDPHLHRVTMTLPPDLPSAPVLVGRID